MWHAVDQEELVVGAETPESGLSRSDFVQLEFVVSCAVKDLHTVIIRIRDVDIAAFVNRDSLRKTKLSITSSCVSELKHITAVVGLLTCRKKQKPVRRVDDTGKSSVAAVNGKLT
jgi:hypothetical protein